MSTFEIRRSANSTGGVSSVAVHPWPPTCGDGLWRFGPLDARQCQLVDGHAGPWDALQILLYDDQEFSWPAVYDEGLRPDVKCGERDMVHSYHPQHGGHIDGHIPCDGRIPVRWQRGGPNAEAHWLHSLGEGEGYGEGDEE